MLHCNQIVPDRDVFFCAVDSSFSLVSVTGAGFQSGVSVTVLVSDLSCSLSFLVVVLLTPTSVGLTAPQMVERDTREHRVQGGGQEEVVH